MWGEPLERQAAAQIMAAHRGIFRFHQQAVPDWNCNEPKNCQYSTNTTMNGLPLEIIDIIVSHLPKWTDDVAQPRRELVRPKIASVSRKWQLAVERVVCREVRFKNAELDAFASVFSQPRRRALIETLRFEIVLPTYSDTECAVYESDQDRLANNRAASEAVASLLHLLSGWGSDPDVAFVCFFSCVRPWIAATAAPTS